MHAGPSRYRMGERSRDLLGGREIRRLLDAHGLHPTKRRGQNFVTDPGTVRRIVRDAGVEAGDLIVEVGPGLGSLTLALLEAGAQVIAVELDRGLAAALEEVVGPDVPVVVGDALDQQYRELTSGRRAAMVANLPYNVATPILLTGLREGHLAAYHLMVQREVGERWVAGPGEKAYGAVSVKIRLLADAAIAGTVSRQAFHPVPNVDSVTVDVRPHGRHDLATVERTIALVEAGFAQRRKLLRNALAVKGRRGVEVDGWLEAVGLPPTARAEELGVDQWLALRRVADHGEAADRKLAP
ncbi:16S rRNA (adenine(1518)-N(6)/adenine(1519)-N(6))-dimethyltransferase RsmA [Euzebya tangerina]|uniref:16S rRNA (adenine(1518)-N(6)/adenine(1519)-N(6))- dimethyltransferase RsmA n=1 Tax=Euzebya tangerina TaxID=591198 RepID=UPI00196A6C4A|nr:16S rRNA (adenine(1518)-N(6)/adenine(1519)-N(6))-dimethyltransferase RsmA [Euzebya tangerina]